MLSPRTGQECEEAYSDLSAPTENATVCHTVTAVTFLSYVPLLASEKYVYVYGLAGLNLYAELLLGAEGRETMSPFLPYFIMVFVVFDGITHCMLVNPLEVGKNWEKKLTNGLWPALADFIISMFQSLDGVFTLFLPTVGMSILFPITSYVTVEPYKALLANAMGVYHWVPAIMGIGLTTCYLTFLLADDVFAGIDFYLNRRNARLDPPQQYLIQHFIFGNQRDRCTAIQCFIEQLSAQVVRSFFTAFLAGRLVEQAGADEDVIITMQLLVLLLVS